MTNMILDIHFNLQTFLMVMAVELSTGLLIGLIKKKLAKQQAINNPERLQVFLCEGYESVGYGTRTPDTSLNAFGLDYSFVIVEFKDREVIRERFMTPFGESIRVEYRHGQTTTKTSLLSAPIYTATVVLPILMGCLTFIGITQLSADSFNNAYEVASIIGDFTIYFFASGVFFVTALSGIPSVIATTKIVTIAMTSSVKSLRASKQNQQHQILRQVSQIGLNVTFGYC